jgi:hypothetical protein
MSTDDLKQKTMSFIQGLRSLRDEAIKGNLERYCTWKLFSERLNDYESDLAANPYQFPGGEHEFFKCVKWYYWNILYSLFGEDLTKFDPFFNRLEVPIVLPGIECLFESEQVPGEKPAEKTTPDAQAPEQIKAVQADTIKVTLKWLQRDRHYITRYTAPEKPVMRNGAIEYIEPSVSEWRIAKPVAFIYRELYRAAEAGEIPLAKDAVADFMINNLKQKDGGDIKKDSLKKAAKRTKAAK